MSALADLLRLVSAALAANGTPFALVGGLAVSAWTDPRFTKDVDLAVSVADDDEAEAVVVSLGPRFRPLAFVEHTSLRRLAMARMGSALPGDEHTQPVVDLLFASSGIEPEITASAEPVEVLPGVTVPLSGVGHLLALKVLSVTDRRRLDEQDLIQLLDVASDQDLDVAREALELITSRGAARGRDLAAAFDSYVARWGTGTEG